MGPHPYCSRSGAILSVDVEAEEASCFLVVIVGLFLSGEVHPLPYPPRTGSGARTLASPAPITRVIYQDVEKVRRHRKTLGAHKDTAGSPLAGVRKPDVPYSHVVDLGASATKTLGAHRLAPVHKRSKTLPAQGTRPAHHSRASTTVALIILRAVDLAGAHKHGALSSSHRAPRYSSRRGPRCGRAAERRVSARRGRAGENNGFFEHLAGFSDPVRAFVNSLLSGPGCL